MKRSSKEIKADVLRAVERERKPTWIMYQTRISWRPLQAMLRDLQERGLIQSSEPDRRDGRSRIAYELTQKGRVFLHDYDRMSKLLEAL